VGIFLLYFVLTMFPMMFLKGIPKSTRLLSHAKVLSSPPSHLYRWGLIGTHYIETSTLGSFQSFNVLRKIKNGRAYESGSLPKIIIVTIIIGRHAENKELRTRR
jgi:hypothetical protein